MDYSRATLSIPPPIHEEHLGENITEARSLGAQIRCHRTDGRNKESSQREMRIHHLKKLQLIFFATDVVFVIGVTEIFDRITHNIISHDI
jgi:hypothetical protein